MFSRLKNSLLFRLEQTMVRGPAARFALLLILVVLVATVAGLLARALAPGFESAVDAIWWAFLRLTDPGYLGDDQGIAKATISTAVTLLGYVLFTGALIAILVQWLGETMDRLEQGLTPVAFDAHFVLLGWTSRTLTILQEILFSQGRVERFLHQRGARRLRVALLAERADASLGQHIKLELGDDWNDRQIILRCGTPLRLDDLARVDFAHAGAILIPAADTTASSTLDADTRTVKTLMTMGAALEETPPEEPPLVVVELQHMRHASTLRALYPGPMEIIAGDETISRLVVQNVRHPGLSHVYGEFLSDVSGSQIYVREGPKLAGVSIQQLAYAFPEGVLLGVVRPRGDDFQALLNPPDDLRLEANDRIAVLAPSYGAAAPPETMDAVPDLPGRPAPKCEALPRRRVLVLGWNHRVPALLEEFSAYSEEAFAIDIVSEVSAAKREKRIKARALYTEHLEIRQLEFDYTVPAYLESVDPAGYDNLVLLSSERIESDAESDARTILGYLLLRQMMEGAAKAPPVLVELSDPDNVPLFENRRGEVIVSPLIISRMLARVALRRELRAVFDELFGSGGSEIFFRRIADSGLAENHNESEVPDAGERIYSFADLQRAADARGEIAIGIRRTGHEGKPGGGVQLNPGRDERLRLKEDDEIIVLTTYR
jgi:Trk K+ transport system NAD-binding subunit